MTLVIYHDHCIDGFTAAWAAWRKFGDAAEYMPASYGSEPPDVTGKDVYIVDFSYPRAKLETMCASANVLVVLDHHKTAEEDLRGLSCATFDMNRSGAGLTWDVLHGTDRPWLVDYVEDRDLWRFALDRSKDVNAFIGAHKRVGFETWDRLASRTVDEAAQMGAGISMFIDRYVDEMCGQASLVKFGGHVVPIVNAPYINISELVGELAKTWPFAVGWFQDKDGMFRISLRSRGELDVSSIAKAYGGGGHKNAAGFHLTVSPFTLLDRVPGEAR